MFHGGGGYFVSIMQTDILCSRSRSNPVKTLSKQKVDREGQMLHVIADALFRITIDS